jgi:hypothetical protein
MGRDADSRISRAGSYVVGAGETRPAKVVGRISGKVTVPTKSDRRAARALVRLKKA